MKASFDYMPVLRVRTHELELLKGFDFGERICPCIEIVKEKGKTKKISYSIFYEMVIRAIKCNTVFVDIPIQLKMDRNTNPKVANFLLPMRDVEHRIKAFTSITPLGKIVPVISSYHHLTGAVGTIKKQVTKLRPMFPRLAFRVSAKDPEFQSEMDQVEEWLTEADHLIVDFCEDSINYNSDHVVEIKNRLANIHICPVVILRSAIPHDVKYKDFENDEEVPGSDNRLQSQYKLLNASAFGDYAGIKRDLLPKSGGGENTVFGCIFYDSTENKYYGYKGAGPGYSELKDTVIPAVLQSDATKRMQADELDFISDTNLGWRLLHDAGTAQPGQLKRVSMEHYLHCIKVLIAAGRFR
jgi:hypothetical protein